ncbi:MAG: NAD(P)/FAD-dependent oxidoreductase [Lachnospiraceae bacterium]|nr:NAD(P)/FAD-dependent oxidoreductase [Lachnospiraceae bacterium]
MSRKFDVIVVGAGASGLTAAIQAARKGARVLILEHMDRAAKKLLATGNGKCNFTNEKQGIAYYNGKNPAFVLPVFEQFGLSETLQFFCELGVYPKNKRDGYYYPASEQAAAMAEVLLMECKRLQIRIAYNIGIREIRREAEGFSFHTKQGIFISACCIIATGGKAAKKTGSDGSGMHYVIGFGHKLTALVPALVQMQGKQSFLKEIAGIRIEGTIRLYIENKMAAQEEGELQLTEFGISGIPAFQVSRCASYGLLEGKGVFADLNFLPKLNAEETNALFTQRFLTYGTGKNAVQALIGLFPFKLIGVLLKEARISPDQPAKNCTQKELTALANVVRALRIDIIGTKGFDHAQVTAGGVETRELNPATMESLLVPGLYFAGEVVDIDGLCGGYNLQWAWSSGAVAGTAAAEAAVGTQRRKP